KLHFAGAQHVQVNAAGELVVRAEGRELKWQKPIVYQQDKTGKHAVAAHFRLKKLSNGQAGVSFALGHYDTARSLVIDPVLTYSTYLGGSAAFGRGDYATAIAVDRSGNAYVTGNAYSIDFPINSDPSYLNTSNATVFLNENNTSAAVAFVTKINATGTNIVYSTFLGGNTRDSGEAIGVDSKGNAYVAGETSSNDFPVTLGAFQTAKFVTTGDTVFVTAINPAGTALIYSTYLGGTSQDEAFAIAVDSAGNAYVAGDASSINFPVSSPAFQPRMQASQGQTAFVTKFDPAGNRVYSTYLGGEYQDQASGIAVDANGNAYVTGWTNSGRFPTTTGAFQATAPQSSRSDSSAYVAKLNPSGTALSYSTYLGGTTGSGDIGYAIAVDSAGSAYVTGAASAFDFPVTSGAFQATSHRTVAYTSFVTKLNPKGTALVYSTYLGGSQSPHGADGDIGHGIAVDADGYAYVAGETTNIDFPTTLGSFQRVGPLYNSAVFVTKVNPTGTALAYSTYLSGSGVDPTQAGEFGRGIALDSTGSAYVTGDTQSPDFPVTANAFQKRSRANVGGANSFVTKLPMISAFPDFSNDNFTDLLIQNTSTGALASWFMRGAVRSGGSFFSLNPPAEYGVVGLGDFSGTGVTTLVLQSSISNQIALWYTGGTNLATITGGDFVNITPAAGWKVVGVGDFNGDGKSDLVFQNQTSNQIAIWFMNGANFAGGMLLPFTPPIGWTLVGAGDFNADGLSDLAFQNQTTNQIAIWFMNGTTFTGGQIMTTVPTNGWKVVGVGDYNGDGFADLLFQNTTTNQASLWLTADGFFIGGGTLSSFVPSGFKIVGPR
ncbi:MAG: Cell surface protein, partial [Chthonomonadaceae bacterium]|nr:Cell surface protein [Chthonomonadaceae bacterium]